MVEPWNPVVSIDLPRAVDRTAVQTLGFLARILDLQARFEVFDGGGNETHRCACHDAGHCVAEGGELVDLRMGERAIGARETGWGGGHAVGGEEGSVEEFSVEG